MYNIIGDKHLFAVELEMSGGKWNNKTCLWLKNNRIGDWDDENLLFPFINSVYRIAMKAEKLWLDELNNLDCYTLFQHINPHFNDPNSFFDLSDVEQSQLERFDRFKLDWGENFNSWHLNAVCKKEICIFLWVYNPNGLKGEFLERNSIECVEVPIKIIQEVYSKLKEIIPEKLWPNLLPK